MANLICESCARPIQLGELVTKIQRGIACEITRLGNHPAPIADYAEVKKIIICEECTQEFVLSQFHSRKLRVNTADEQAYVQRLERS